MNIKSHLTYGIAAGALVAITVPCPAVAKIGVISVSAIASLLPDADLPTTKIGRKLWIISNLLNKLFGHRGFIHSPFCCSLLSLLIKENFANEWLWISFAAGYGSHIFLDLFNLPGVPLLYPITKKRFRLAKIKTKDKNEYKYTLLITAATTIIYLLIFININEITGIVVSFT